MRINLFKRFALPGMLGEYVQLIQPASDISAEKHAQLLRMSHERMVYGFTVMPIIATFAAFFYGSQHDMLPMGLWALGYCLAYVFNKRRIQQFDLDFSQMDGHLLMAKWAGAL